MGQPDLHIVLFHPEIPQNTGAIGRLVVALDLPLHIVHPISFDLDEKKARRAGIDHWKDVDLREHENEAAFWRWAQSRRVHLFSSHGARAYTACPVKSGDLLLFGCESVGLPEELVDRHGAWRIPMIGSTRSLNLANAVSVVAYRHMERLRPDLFC